VTGAARAPPALTSALKHQLIAKPTDQRRKGLETTASNVFLTMAHVCALVVFLRDEESAYETGNIH